MIVRRVPTRAGRSGSFKRLGEYVTSAAAPGSAMPAEIAGGLGSYIADQVRHADRVEWIRISNCGFSDSVKGAIAEITATQSGNTRSKVDPNYHLIVAFPPGERPTRAQIEDIEDTLVRGLGLAEHQRISALHGDKDHLHLHVAINLIHPETLKAASVYRDYAKLAQMAVTLEIKHGLERTNHETAQERDTRRPAAARAMEAHTEHESFVAWVRRVAGAELVAAGQGGGGWTALHDTAARFGLEIRQRGAGLVIGKAGEPALMMKASDLDRSMGYGRLVERLGAFVPAADAIQRPEPERAYVREVAPERRQDRDLWRRFSEGRDQALHDRGLPIADNLAQERRYRAEVEAHYRAKFAEIKRLKLTIGIDPHIRYQALKQERAKLLVRHRDELRQQRAAIRAKHQVPTWPDWLRREAEAGDHQAVVALRGMASRRERFVDSLIRVPDKASEMVAALGLKPTVARNGDATYRLPDGGAVVDRADGVRLAAPSRAAAVLALQIARDRAGDAPLAIDGDEKQRRVLLDTAVQFRFDVRFADPTLEAERARRVRAIDEAESVVRPERGADSIQAFIDDRNAWPDPADPTHYRVLSAADTGQAQLVATHRLEGAEIALWRFGGETLVQDITDQPEARAHRLLPGDMVDLAESRPQAGRENEPPISGEDRGWEMD